MNVAATGDKKKDLTHIEEKTFVTGCCCWRRAGQKRSQVSVGACSDVLWHVFGAWPCRVLCLFGKQQTTGRRSDLTQQREALLAESEWLESKSACCVGTKHH